jgi:chlorite dismutase
LAVLNELVTPEPSGGYALVGVTSNERYVVRAEKRELGSAQVPIGRPETVVGAFIPIRKHDDWWALPQDERRKIFEEDSRHIAIGMTALPGVSRRLHHCRDLGASAPFDFLTWFDFAPEQVSAFDDLLGALRATEEWRYVVREVDVRVRRV